MKFIRKKLIYIVVPIVLCIFVSLLSIDAGDSTVEIRKDMSVMQQDTNSETIYNQTFKDDIQSFALSLEGDKSDLYNHLEYRYGNDGLFSDWDHVELEGDLESVDVFSKLHFVGRADSLEVKFEDEHSDYVNKKIEVIAFRSSTHLSFDFNWFSSFVLAATDGIDLVPRYKWGADESLRFYDPNNPPPVANKVVEVDDDWKTQYADEIKIVKVEDTDAETGKRLIWPLEYTSDIQKIVIHHSAGRNPSCSEEEDFLRSIYKFHTVTRGWGDIGYNYVVGTCSGKVYQGRAGMHTKGAHAGKFNAKTVGVMVMGDFRYDIPSDAAVNTLVELVKHLGEVYGIWPDGYSEMRGINLPNVFGHKTIGNTSCPGENLDSRISYIREKAMVGFNFPKNPYHLYTEEKDILEQKRNELFSAHPVISGTNQLFMKPGDTATIKVMFENVGTRVWNSQTYLKINGAKAGLKFEDTEGSNHDASLKETTVVPNKVGSFESTITADSRLEEKEFVLEIVPYINGIYSGEDAAQKFVVIIIDSDELNPEGNQAEEGLEGIYNERQAKGIELGAETDYKDEDSSPVHADFFEDVTEDNVFYEYIDDLRERGIVVGNNSKFLPEDEITRGEFSKILAKSAGLELIDNKRSFLDISGGTFEEYIRILQSHDIVKGQNGMFYPHNYLSRAEAIKMVVNAFDIQGETSHEFRDMKENEFESYVLRAVSVGVIGAGSIFDPKALITRDQVAKIISKALDYKEGNSYTVDVKKKEVTDRGPIVRLDLNFLNESFEITSDKAYSIMRDGKVYKRQISAGGVTTITKKENLYEIKIGTNRVYETGIFTFVPTDSGIMQIQNESRVDKGTTKYNRYRGSLEIRADIDDSSKMYIVNILPLEDYILGLGEEPEGQEIEKMKAIFVMARSYIEYYRNKGGKFPERFVDLKSDGATSQVYLGYDFEVNNPSVVKVANETYGEVIIYNGEVIRAPYFSRSLGHTFTPGTEGNTWNPDSFPFAKRVEDPWSCDKDLDYLEEFGPIECPDNQRGHGIGVSAWGAKEMAKDGKGYREILNYFLTGIEFENLYE